MFVRSTSLDPALPDLPGQPAGVPWPTLAFPRGAAQVDPDALARHTAGVFELPPDHGVTYALLIVHGGRLVFERYAAGASPIYLQYSWSMAKSVTQALVGIAAGDGLLDIYAPARVPEWADDPARSRITVDQLLRMRSGLAFREDYGNPGASDVIPMLAGAGRTDTGAFAAAMPLVHEPDSTFSYSSGTTNILCRLLRDAIGGPTEMLAYMRERLFEPLGMRTPVPHFDHAGTWVGSSFLFAIPEDFARFGLLYLRGGVWDGRRILPEGWVDYARSRSHDDGVESHGAHWWLRTGRNDLFWASGYDGQRIVLAPRRDLLILRCGRTPKPQIERVWEHVFALAELFDAPA